MEENRSLIVLIEDNEPTRKTLKQVLTRAGWRVLSAATAAEGLAFLDWEPLCVVLDLVLPDARGEAVLRQVRQAHPETHVIVTTGLGDDADLEAVRQLQPAAVFQKPIEVNEFLSACHRVAPVPAGSHRHASMLGRIAAPECDSPQRVVV